MRVIAENIIRHITARRHDSWRVVFFLMGVLLIGGVSLARDANARRQARKHQEQKETFTRPKMTQPVKPTVPDANRFRSDKVFLENADSLYRVAYDVEERQIVKGNVKFRQAGMWMFCDSAYYYPEINSMDAFGHVRMEQGDTLFVYADKVFYNGDERMARLRCGGSEPKVRLVNRNVTLTTDSLDYSLAMELGWYAYGGKIDDKVNTLTSVYGEYSPGTKNADFYNDVVLVNNRDGFTMYTDTLYYNTATHIARIESETEIQGENDTILTRRGIYNTEEGNAELISRSTIIHRDTNNNVTTLEGDSIIYDKLTRISRAYMFRDPFKVATPMVLTDTAHKTKLIGGFGMYNDSTKEAHAAEYPLLIEYSRPDTIFLRADTIKTFILMEKVWPDSLLAFGKDSIADPSVRHDSVAEHDSIMALQEDISGIIAAEDTVARDSSLMVDKEFHVALAYNRARFFKQDLQGVADSMVFHERDSILYMFRKPVVWSGERQVFGNRIDVHINDSTADWALLPEFGMMIEYVGEDFYNQLTGKKMLATFENQELKRLEADGNVETIFLPQESDSTYNRLINAESSFLTIDMTGKEMDKLKMWPEVSGTVTPLFLVKKPQQYLQKFVWLDPIRPKREWYGGRVRWADDLGEVPDELDLYFSEPPIFPETAQPVMQSPLAPMKKKDAVKEDIETGQPDDREQEQVEQLRETEQQEQQGLPEKSEKSEQKEQVEQSGEIIENE